MRSTPYLHLAIAALLTLLTACGRGPQTAAESATAVEERVDAGDAQGADELLRAAIVKWPEDSRLRELQGDFDLERGDGTRAQAAYEKALRGAPKQRGLQVKLARALLVQNRLREVLLLAEPMENDSVDLQAGFGLLRLEAQLAQGMVQFDEARRSAERLWRLADGDSTTPALLDVRRRLAELAPRAEAIEAGRQHAQCKPPARPAPSAESDMVPGTVLRVGPGEALRTPGAAAAVAKDGAVIDIAVGDYDEGIVTWTQNDLTLRGLRGRPKLRSTAAQAAAIWLLKGDRTVVENVEFAGDGRGGAGIRLEGAYLTVRGSVFRGNGTGIAATVDAPDSEILITGSEFAGDAAREGASIDVGRIARLTVEFSHIHGELSGQHLQSRARATAINYNRIVDVEGGAPGALVGLPGGGTVEVLGNEMLRGPGSGGRDFIAFGGEGTLLVLGNAFYNEAEGRTAVRAGRAAPALVANNVFAGVAMTAIAGKAQEAGNLAARDALVDPRNGDFRLRAGSAAIDAAIDATRAPGELLAAAPAVEFEYLHPISGIARPKIWTPDVGAHEYCGSVAAASLSTLPLREAGTVAP